MGTRHPKSCASRVIAVKTWIKPEDDAAYYRKRALVEQVAAQGATCEAARRCHDELAAAYRFRAAILSEQSPEHAEIGQMSLDKIVRVASSGDDRRVNPCSCSS